MRYPGDEVPILPCYSQTFRHTEPCPEVYDLQKFTHKKVVRILVGQKALHHKITMPDLLVEKKKKKKGKTDIKINQ